MSLTPPAVEPVRFWNFSIVMAAGIASIAGSLLGYEWISKVLLVIAAAVFVVIVVVDLRLLGHHFRDIRVELEHPTRAIELFTLVAACGVLGERLESVTAPLACALWIGGLGGWLLASWQALRSLRLQPRPRLGGMVTGSWLLATVGPESLAILGSSIAARSRIDGLLAISAGFWALGLGLYAIVITLVLRRLIRRTVGLSGFTPDYWITMGALAISTLAGIRLASAVGLTLSPAAGAPLEAIAVSTWVLASSWIPYLTVVEVARGLVHPSISGLEPGRWSMVFPLGMYSAATRELGGAAGQPAMGIVADFFFWAALGAFLFAGVVTARSLLRPKPRALC